MEDVAPRRRRAQRSPTPTKRKRSPHSPHRRESKREEKNSKKKKERKRSPSSPSSSPSSSSDEGSGYSSQERQKRGHRRSYATWKRSSKLKKFKEGGKNISFLTYDGTFGATDKVLAFIQQFDAAFGDEGFTESSKLRHVAMHFQKSARQWRASLRANGEAPKTWKALRASIMKQFLASDAKDKVLTEWRSLKLSPYESIHKYVDKFWDLHLKATVYKKIDFEEQKQQFCAGLPEDMNKIIPSFFGTLIIPSSCVLDSGKWQNENNPSLYFFVGCSTSELPAVETYVNTFAAEVPAIMFNLELDTLRADLGLFGFPSKEVHYRFLSQFLPVFYIRTRDYSKTIAAPPFVVDYTGALFRMLPGPWQVMLKQGDGSYVCVAESSDRFTLGQTKEELLTALGLQEEKGSAMAFLRRGYKNSTWWEDDVEAEKSGEWRR
ncbi:hypothetical protein L7F22_053812 [Adiantum nelumboides]|nr:hypothetical protein [Adiantum nelumboides]